MKPARIIALLVLAAVLFFGARDFLRARETGHLYPSTSLTKQLKLSVYNPLLKDTRGDTDIFFFNGQEPGGTVLILGGVHSNEPAGYMAAIVCLENIQVTRGNVIIIPRSNLSAFTHTEPGEATPRSFEVMTARGPRQFSVGSRVTNPLDQWPDPEVYRHFPSGQELSGAETRNLNRNFPGRSDGTFTERVAAAITELIKREHVDLTIDLHEASLEYPVINAIVAHDRALELATLANMNLQAAGLEFAVEPSPKNFHGLSHRELGDSTQTFATLMESANIMQGRLRGASHADKILSGLDHCYLDAAAAKLVRVPYDSTGISLEVRVGRHIAGIAALCEGLAFTNPATAVTFSGIPSYSELQERKIGAYLTPH